MADRFLFGSAYPVVPVDQAVREFLKFPLKDAVIDRVLYSNAAQLLGLDRPIHKDRESSGYESPSFRRASWTNYCSVPQTERKPLEIGGYFTDGSCSR
jgi:hypothetical protein